MEIIEFFLYLVIGLGSAIIGALIGVGGGFLMVPCFSFMGLTKDYAPVLSLFVILFMALSASLKYGREKLINYRLGLFYASFSVIGAFLGAYFLHIVNNLVFKIIFSCLAVVVGIQLVLKRAEIKDQAQNGSTKSQYSYYWVILWGVLTGIVSSFLGIGGGLIAVPVLYLFFLETMHVAIATSLFIMIFTASVGTLQHALLGYLDVSLVLIGLVVVIGAIIGSQIGSMIQLRLKGRTLQLLFGGFMIGVALPLLWLGS